MNYDFTNGNDDFRPVPFWSWNGKMTFEKIEEQCASAAEGGMGGLFLHARSGLITKYMSQRFLDATRAACRSGARHKLDIWLYDEDKWPSGWGGGAVTQVGEYRISHLVLDTPQDGDKALAEYNRQSICIRRSDIGLGQYNGYCYADLFNPDAVDEFIDSTHEKYVRALRKFIGYEVKGIFTDECAYQDLYNVHCPSLPYSKHLEAYFEKECGISFAEKVCELFFDVGDYKRTRLCYYKCATRLFADTYMKRCFDWCNKNNLKLTGHVMCEDSLIDQTRWIGSAMAHYEYMSYPGVDLLGASLNRNLTLKQLTSAAAQLGKERTLCETFACIGQHASCADILRIASWLCAHGISFINPHLFPYSISGERKRDYPPALSPLQPYWAAEAEVSAIIARMCRLAKETEGGRICVIHPITSVWGNYSPVDNTRAKALSDEYDLFINSLVDKGIAFDLGDEMLMEKYASISGGNLRIAQKTYDTVIIPPCDTMGATQAKLISKFKGQLIAVGKIADNVEYKNSYSLPKSASRVENVDELIARLEQKTVIKGAFFTHRYSKNDDVYFVVNTDFKGDCNVTVETTDTRNMYMLDFTTAKIYNCPSDFSLPYGGSCAVIFTTQKLSAVDREKAIGCIGHSYSAVKQIDFTKIFTQTKGLRLDKVSGFIGDFKFENENIDFCHGEFFKVPDGTPFECTYNFNIEKLPESSVYAVIEGASALSSVTLNGVPCTDKCGFWLEEAFEKINVTGLLMLGENVIKICGVKRNNFTGIGESVSLDDTAYSPTETEAIFLLGDFENPDFEDVCEYECTLPESIAPCSVLKIAGDFAAAQISIGKRVKTLVREPFEAEVFEFEGGKRVHITLYNTLYNALGPVHVKNALSDGYWLCPSSFCDRTQYTPSPQYLPFGLKTVTLES